jgi:hypothetical protein
MIVQRKPTLFDLMRLRGRTGIIALAAAVGFIAGGFFVNNAGFPIWGGTIMFLGAIAVPVALKFHDDLKIWGTAACVLSVLLLLQAFHATEHTVQLVQYYLMNNPSIMSQGLISSLNVEIVHFTWNWINWACVVYLFRSGMRKIWGYPLLLWITMHCLEHTYMLLHYFHVVGEMSRLGLNQSDLTAVQTLPSILGKDGWLASNIAFCRAIPGLTTLPRVAIHAYWNLGELVFLFLAARESIPKLMGKGRSFLR